MYTTSDMQCVILAGGLGTRLSEHTNKIPKPLIEIGNIPILVHIMRHYYKFGVNKFIICAGYKAHKVNEYFANYPYIQNDYEFNIGSNQVKLISNRCEDWNVKVINTGYETMTGGRLAKVKKYLSTDKPFFMTYGDGLADVDIQKLLKSHTKSRAVATVTAVEPPARFGALSISQEDGLVTRFAEKPAGEFGRINGGYFVVEKCALELIDGGSISWEKGPMEKLAKEGNLNSYLHNGFFHPMDTDRDRKMLQGMWDTSTGLWANE